MWKKIFSIIVILSLWTGSALSQSELRKVRINDFSCGMVSNSASDILSPNQGTSLVNVVLSVKGKVSKRKGQTLFVKDVSDVPFRGTGRFDPDRNTSYFVAASGVDIVRALSSSQDWTIINPTSPQTVNNDTEFIQANDLLFILNGQDKTTWYSGASYVTAGTYPTSPPTAKIGAWLRNYLFLSGNPSEQDWVYFSNNLEPTVFSASDAAKKNKGEGQAVQRLVPFRLNELIIYKERSIFVLDITGATPLIDWTVQPISKVIGLIAPRSVVSMGDDQWFLSSNPIAVRSLVRSDFDKILTNIVSQPIQDIFDGTGPLTINRDDIDLSAGIYFDNKFILAVPTGTSTVNNTVLAYDFIAQGWYIIDGWFPAEWEIFDERLFYMDANDGRVIECFTSNISDYPNGPNTITSTTSTPPIGIAWEVITRDIDFDEPENFKILDAIEFEFDPTGNFYAENYINLDNKGWASIGAVSLAANGNTLPITLPTTLNDSGLARRTIQLQQYGRFKKMKVRTRNSTSGQNVILQRMTIFGRVMPWERE